MSINDSGSRSVNPSITQRFFRKLRRNSGLYHMFEYLALISLVTHNIPLEFPADQLEAVVINGWKSARLLLRCRPEATLFELFKQFDAFVVAALSPKGSGEADAGKQSTAGMSTETTACTALQ